MEAFLAFLGALVLAALTAISIIAYRHPKGYAKLFRTIGEFLIWMVFGIAGFAIGVGGAHRMLIPYIQPGKQAAAANEIARVTPNPLWTLLIFLAIFGFFAFLSRLPQILEHDPDDKIER